MANTPDSLPVSTVADIPISPGFGREWKLALAAAGAFVLLLLPGIGLPVLVGIGVWGTNVPYVWGFDLVNYVWWIGIANGTSLFAAILVIRRHDLRTSVNRFAEGAALFAVLCAAIYPVIHLGRPWLFYWTLPYPATHGVWPQFRSTLTWDLWAISAHVIVTSLLWYTGLIPDLATLRDRDRRPGRKAVFGFFALGWRGSVRHWAYHQAAYRVVAGLVLPLILIMQSTVAFEFAVTLVPDWHETRQPLHFVVTGAASGLAMVLLVAVSLRQGLGLARYIDDGDIELMSRLVLATAVIVAFLYVEEAFTSSLAGSLSLQALLARMFDQFALTYWAAIVLSVVVPQILWVAWARVSLAICALVSVSVLVGVWLDRFSIVVGGLQQDYLSSTFGAYLPTLSEWALLAGTLGLFTLFLLLFVRALPVISLFEARHAEHEEKS
jgi:Ni/Fe-hydrogenase subunit HybB-like protein